MATLKQGESFDETPIKDQNGNKVDMPVNDIPSGDTGQQASSGPKLPFNLSPKILAIGAGVIVVIAVAIFAFPKSSTTTEDIVSNGGGGATVDTTVTTTAPTLDPSTNEYGEPLAPGSGEEIVNPYEYLIYTEDDVATLREMGYTGDEIEYASQQGKSFDEMYNAAVDARDEQYKTWRESILDQASDGYLDLMSRSELDGTDTSNTRLADADYAKSRTEKENVDYKKCGVYNYQCWIKVELSTGSTLMTLNMQRYNNLPDTGNILVQYERVLDQNDKLLYIRNLKELEF